METIAYIINNLLLILYTICGGIDLGIGSLILLTTLFKKDNKFLFNIFNPLWEINNVFLIFFIISFMFFFPKAIDHYSNLLIIPTFIAIFFGFLRASSFTYLHFYNKNSKVFQLMFGFSSIFMALFLFSYYAINIRNYSDSIDFLQPTLLNFATVLFVLVTITALGSSFVYALIKKDDFIHNGEFVKNIYIRSVIAFVLVYSLISIIIFQQTTLANQYFFFEFILVLICLLSSIYLAQKHKVLPCVIFVLIIISIIFNLMIAKYPKISVFSDLTIYNTFTNKASFDLMMIALGAGIIFTIPGLIVFYKMFLSDKFTNSYDDEE